MTYPAKKLGDCLAQFDRGISWSRKDEGGAIAVLRIPNIQEGQINLDGLKYISAKNGNGELDKNDIVMVASNGNPDLVGRSALVTEKEEGMRFASFLIRLRFDNAKLLSQYAHLFLLTPTFKRELRRKIATTSGIYNLKKEHIEKIKIPLLPLAIQKQIVERLDKIAEAQKLNNDLIQKSDELFQSLLHQELNPAGKNWEVKKLGDVCEIARGGSPRPINKYLTNSPDGINWIKIGDVKEGEMYITSTKQKISSEGVSKTRLVKEGDFILSNSMSFGRPYILKISGAIHDGWLLMRIKNKRDLLRDFLYYILGATQTKIQFERAASGGVVRNLNSDLVRKVKISVPSLEEQKQIIAKLSAVQEYKTQLLAQKSKLKELFNSVLHKSMSNK